MLSAAPASAQIYSWRDANGNLVLANTPQAGRGGQIVRVLSGSGVDQHPYHRARVVAGPRADVRRPHHRARAGLNDVRPDLVRAVVQVESAFNPYARSPKGAQGLMQLMPATAHQFGVKNAFNPEENVRAGVAYLRQLLDRYENNEELALAAYNAGPGAVDKYGQTVPPYAETKNYVAQISQITARPIARRDEPHLQGDRGRRRPPRRPLHRQAPRFRHLRRHRPVVVGRWSLSDPPTHVDPDPSP